MTLDRKQRLRQLLASTNALIAAMRYSVDSHRSDDAWKYSSYRTFMDRHNALIKDLAPHLDNGEDLRLYNLANVKGSMDTVASEQKMYFDSVYSDTLILRSLIEGEIGFAEDETQSFTDFVQANLRRVIFARPEWESEIQNALESLLVGRGMSKGIDYDRETGRVKTSGKESVPDLILQKLQLCVEVKLSKTPERSKELVDEINADIRSYSTRYDRQLYVIYDLGTIRDEAEFKKDLESAPGVHVVIVKH